MALQATQIITKQAFELETGYVWIYIYHSLQLILYPVEYQKQVEETFGKELSKREFKANPSMYNSESRAQLDRTAKIVEKEGVTSELLAPPQAASQK